MRLLVVFGTRPECIKLAPIISLALEHGVEILSCVTGQHSEMLAQCLDVFNIKADFNLSVMRPNQALAGLTGRILDGIAPILDVSKPDCTIVQGDTTTAFAAALASFYARVPVAHVEAGLRTHNLSSPFPEEAMRQMVSRLASWHFAPTEENLNNLIKEGIPRQRIFVTGNTVIDAVLATGALVRSGEKREHLSLPETILDELNDGRAMVLITGHRRENFGKGIEGICAALKILAKRFSDTMFLYPVHLNPNVRVPVEQLLGSISNIRLIEPVNYYTFVYLMERSRLIISDSGGVQEEAPSLRRPVFVTREHTERIEAVKSGAVKLVGTDSETIANQVSAALLDKSIYDAMLAESNPYGDGKAAQRILDSILTSK